MTTKQRQQLLALVRQLTNEGRHLEAQEIYDEVMIDFRRNK